MRRVQILTLLAVFTIVSGQGCSHEYPKETSSIVITNTVLPTGTSTPTPHPTVTPTPEIKPDTVYFWWSLGEKSELWSLEPNGNAKILYTVYLEYTLEEVITAGLLSKEGIDNIKNMLPADSENAKGINTNALSSISIIPISLSLSPDKTKLAWQEEIGYCPSDQSCYGESLIRVLDLTSNSLQTSVDTNVISKLIWSQDNKHIAFTAGGRTVKTLDTRTLSIETVREGDDVCWFPDGQNLAYEIRWGLQAFEIDNGINVYSLQTKQSAPILTNAGDILNLAISPNGENLVYTYFNVGNTEYMYTQNLKTGKTKPIIDGNDGLWLYNVQWLSNTEILYTQQKSYSDPYFIYVRDLETGEQVLKEKIPLDIRPDLGGELSADSSKILFVGFNYTDTLALIVFDLKTKNWLYLPLPQPLQEIISSKANELWSRIPLRNATW